MIDIDASATEYEFFDYVRWCVTEGNLGQDKEEWEKSTYMIRELVEGIDKEESGVVKVRVKNTALQDGCGFVHIVAWSETSELVGMNSAYTRIGANRTATVQVPYIHIRESLQAASVSIWTWNVETFCD